MRGLLIGASGQLGRALETALRRDHEVIPSAYRHGLSGDLVIDLGDVAQTRSALEDVGPEFIVIAGAMCAVDRCEIETDACYRINVLGTRVVAEYARARGAKVVFYSTDHVFDGTREIYREVDAPGPLNVYARSKAEAEVVLREMLPDGHLVIRTSWVYGPDPQRRNFNLRCIDRLSAGERVVVPADQWGSPTYTDDLASVTCHLLRGGHTGTFHATGPDFVSREALALRVCAHFGLDGGLIMPRPTSELGQAARRPLKTRLDCSKLRATGAASFRGVEEGLESLKQSESSALSL